MHDSADTRTCTTRQTSCIFLCHHNVITTSSQRHHNVITTSPQRHRLKKIHGSEPSRRRRFAQLLCVLRCLVWYRHVSCSIVVSCVVLFYRLALWCVVLCCVVLCRVVLCRVVSCCVVFFLPCLFCVVSCRVVSCRVASCRVVLCCFV